MEGEAASYCQGSTRIFEISTFSEFILNIKSSRKHNVNNWKFRSLSFPVMFKVLKAFLRTWHLYWIARAISAIFGKHPNVGWQALISISFESKMRCCSARRTLTEWIFAVLTNSGPDLATLPLRYFGVVPYVDCACSGMLETLFMFLSRNKFADHRWKALQNPSFLLSQLVYSSNQNVKSNCGLWIRRK